MKKFLLISLAAAPALAFGANTSGFNDFIDSVKGTVDKLIPFLVGLALLGFFWGLVVFIFQGNTDETKRGEAKMMMIYAIIALFVMTAIWGLVGFLGTAVGIDQGTGVTLPTVPSV